MKKLIYILLLCNLLFAIICLFKIDIQDAFEQKNSTVLFDKHGRLLGAQIAADDQWRFPLIDSIPLRYEKALLSFEDKRFYKHPGVDVFSILRAMKSNIRERKIVSGASTITMQLMRLSRNRDSRSLKQKIVESYLALLYTAKYDKETILRYYATHAPFGGNVVGVETAAWRYFGRGVYDLSWAEASTLAVLPNSPALMHPGKNRNALKAKRDRLLSKLLEEGTIDSMEYNLGIAEALPEAPKPIPNLASHYLEKCKVENPETSKFVSEIDFHLQKNISSILKMHEAFNAEKGIHNASVIVRENETGDIISYIGNTDGHKKSMYNDMATTARSTGSILKPLLFACSLEESLLTPKELLTDVPIQLDGFQPKNYDKNYRGLVPADEALSKSLNIPFVLMLQKYGVDRFISRLHDFGFSTIDKSADHYGLSLILGGAEVTLEELTKAYAELGNLVTNPGTKTVVHPATAYHMFEAMTGLKRPNEDHFWESFESSGKFAWKTGTSFGNRDAWAIGVCPKYTIGVWVGNSDGEARPDIIGSSLAGPVLFDVVHGLADVSEFKEPLKDMKEMVLCKKSGMKASIACNEKAISYLSPSLDQSAVCTFHQIIHVDSTSNYRVSKDCYSDARDTSWFVASPKQALFLKRFDPSYHSIPRVHPDCIQSEDDKQLDIVYPQEKSSFAIPNNLKNEKESIVCEVAHQSPNTRVYWHLNDEYLGMTEEFHKISINSGIGTHKLYVIDEHGRYDETVFEIIK